jgi:hypothetical protein
MLAIEATGITLATIDGAEEGLGGAEAVGFLFVTCERIFAGELFVFAFNVAADVSLEGRFDIFSSLRISKELVSFIGRETNFSWPGTTLITRLCSMSSIVWEATMELKWSVAPMV